MEKVIDFNQSQTVNGFKVTLERVELTSKGAAFYVFFIPPGYIPPEPIEYGPTVAIMARAEYSFAGDTRDAGTAGFGIKGDGLRLVWGENVHHLAPVPIDAKELIFTITEINEVSENIHWEGPWEFKIPLE